MRKIHFAFLFCIVFACKKNSVDSPQLRLRRIVVPNNISARDSAVTTINYDLQGRIINVSYKAWFGAITNSFNISYVNGEILIKPATRSDIKDVWEIRYTVNRDGLPVKRLEYHSVDYLATGADTKSNTYDTTLYEYSKEGLLLKTTKGTINTSIYSPSWQPAETTLYRNVVTTTYKNDNNLKKSFHLTRLFTITRTIGANSSMSNEKMENSTTFEYLKNYSNKFDYSNTVVMNECFYIFNETDNFNINYKSLPDKIVETLISTDFYGNVITSTYPSQFELVYDKNGLLSEQKETDRLNNITVKKFIYGY